MLAEGSWPLPNGQELTAVETAEDGRPVREFEYDIKPDEDGHGCVKLDRSEHYYN